MITIENKSDSGVALLQNVGIGEKSALVPFAFPSERKEIGESYDKFVYLTRVPVTEVSAAAIMVTEGAREKIPIVEVIGKNLEAYMIESAERKVNGITIAVGTSVEDAGINFIAS